MRFDIPDFESSQFSAARTSGVQRHQDGAVEGSGCGVDEPGDFLLAQHRGETVSHLGIRRLGYSPPPPERLDKEEAQSREVLGNAHSRQFLLPKQMA